MYVQNDSFVLNCICSLMKNIQEIAIAEYDYPLPDERIAKYPLAERDTSKLLLYRSGEIIEEKFSNLPGFIPQGALMVFNNTRVIQARLRFRKETVNTPQTTLSAVRGNKRRFQARFRKNFDKQFPCRG